MHDSAFSKKVVTWYKKYGRKDLPWQQNVTPYTVWISEVMLQQTQVATVIPYFDRFLQRFPTIQSLASSNNDDVLHYWSGLGYYSRARNLHASAKIIVDEFAGEFPNSLEELQSLPGIGRSTAGAILALAFKKPATILDGNVKRVLSRYYCIAENKLWDIAERLTPPKNIAEYTQAMMDLGALICTRVEPACHRCPLMKTCQAYASQKQHLYPVKKEKKSIPKRSSNFLILVHQNKILLEKRPSTGIWGGLWCFPQCSTKNDIKSWCTKNYGLTIIKTMALPTVLHTFSHFQLMIKPIQAEVKTRKKISMASSSLIWYDPKNPAVIGLAAPIKKLLKQFQRISK